MSPRGRSKQRRDDEPSLFPEDRPPLPTLQQPEVATLAAALPSTLRLGTSSWSFPGWSGLLYEPARPCSEAALARDGLRQYVKSPLLRTTGLDRAFYRPLTVEQGRALAEQAGEGFRFLVKAYRGLTHRGTEGARFLDSQFAVDAVIEPLREGLGSALGTLLVQFPEMGIKASECNDFLRQLDRFLSDLPDAVPISVEVRDRVLLGDSIAGVLAAHGVAFGHAIHPSRPPLAEQLDRLGSALESVTAPAVLRWLLRAEHSYQGAQALYEPFDRMLEPDVRSREEAAAYCRLESLRGRDLFVIANNKAEGSAPLTLLELAKAIVAGVAAT